MQPLLEPCPVSNMKMQICALLLAALVAHVAAQSPTEVLWCVPYDQPQAYADLCTETLAAANTDDVTFKCVAGGTPAEVRNGASFEIWEHLGKCCDATVETAWTGVHMRRQGGFVWCRACGELCVM